LLDLIPIIGNIGPHAVFCRDDRLRPPRTRGRLRSGDDRRDVISRVASGEYKNISFIHEIADRSVDDVTEAILAEAAPPDIAVSETDLQASQFDHARDLRKHETV
jgi:hypothetical protein